MADQRDQLDATKAYIAKATRQAFGVKKTASPAAPGVTEPESPTRQAAEALEPTPQKPAPRKPEEQAVPYDRFKEVIEEKNSLSSKLKNLESELNATRQKERERLREQAMDAVLSKDRPGGFEDWTDERKSAWVADQVTRTHLDAAMPENVRAELANMLFEARLHKVAPGTPPELIEAAARIGVEFQGRLSEQDCIALAAARNPHLVPDGGEGIQGGEAVSPRPKMPPSQVTLEPSRHVRSGAPSEAAERGALMHEVAAGNYKSSRNAATQFIKQFVLGRK